MKNKVILFYSTLIIGVICLLYIELSVLLILFEDGNLLTVVSDILALDPLMIAITKFLSSSEINFYISLLMFISIAVAAILIEDLEEEENESRRNNSNGH